MIKSQPRWTDAWPRLLCPLRNLEHDLRPHCCTPVFVPSSPSGQPQGPLPCGGVLLALPGVRQSLKHWGPEPCVTGCTQGLWVELLMLRVVAGTGGLVPGGGLADLAPGLSAG